jgi:hypothetical protein
MSKPLTLPLMTWSLPTSLALSINSLRLTLFQP